MLVSCLVLLLCTSCSENVLVHAHSILCLQKFLSHCADQKIEFFVNASEVVASNLALIHHVINLKSESSRLSSGDESRNCENSWKIVKSVEKS